MDNVIYKIKKLEQVLLHKELMIKERIEQEELKYQEIKGMLKKVQQEINSIQTFQDEYQECINKITIKIKNIIIWLSIGLLMLFTQVPSICAIGIILATVKILSNSKKIIKYRKNIGHTNMKQLVKSLAEKEKCRDSLKSEAKKVNEDIFILHQNINEIRSNIRFYQSKIDEPFKPLIDLEDEKTFTKKFD